MSSVKDLTGGTGDVNPQILNMVVTQSGNDAATTLEQPIPLPRFASRKGRSVVLEIIRVHWDLDNITVSTSSLAAILSTAPTAVTITDPRTFSYFDLEVTDVGSAGGMLGIRRDYFEDFTDGAGHGLLIGTDNIFLSCISTSTGRANSISCKLFYRYKEVSLEEYLGIVASQQ